MHVKTLKIWFRCFYIFVSLNVVLANTDLQWIDWYEGESASLLSQYLDTIIRNRNTYNGFLVQRHKSVLNILRQQKSIKDYLSLFASLSKESRKKVIEALLTLDFDKSLDYKPSVPQELCVQSLQSFNNFTVERWILFFKYLGHPHVELLVAVILEFINVNGYEHKNGPYLCIQGVRVVFNADRYSQGTFWDDTLFFSQPRTINCWDVKTLSHWFISNPKQVQQEIQTAAVRFFSQTNIDNPIFQNAQVFSTRRRHFPVSDGYYSMAKWSNNYENFLPEDWDTFLLATYCVDASLVLRLCGAILQNRFLGPNYNGLKSQRVKKFNEWIQKQSRPLFDFQNETGHQFIIIHNMTEQQLINLQKLTEYELSRRRCSF